VKGHRDTQPLQLVVIAKLAKDYTDWCLLESGDASTEENLPTGIVEWRPATGLDRVRNGLVRQRGAEAGERGWCEIGYTESPSVGRVKFRNRTPFVGGRPAPAGTLQY
jgi:hypothetical protein